MLYFKVGYHFMKHMKTRDLPWYGLRTITQYYIIPNFEAVLNYYLESICVIDCNWISSWLEWKNVIYDKGSYANDWSLLYYIIRTWPWLLKPKIQLRLINNTTKIIFPQLGSFSVKPGVYLFIKILQIHIRYYLSTWQSGWSTIQIPGTDLQDLMASCWMVGS